MSVALLVLVAWMACTCNGRIHDLDLYSDSRERFVISSFGLLRGGSISVQIGPIQVRVVSLIWMLHAHIGCDAYVKQHVS